MSSKLEVLPGGRHVSGRLGPLHIVVARDDDPPFPVDAAVFEEDTWLAISAISPIIRAPGHPVRVMTAVWESKPEAPGSVVVKPGSPLRLLAIVHDLNADPTCTEDWVAAALRSVFREARERRARAIKLPLLGTKHGRIPVPRFMALLREVLDDVLSGGDADQLTVRRIWLVRDSESGEGLLSTLGADQNPPSSGA